MPTIREKIWAALPYIYLLRVPLLTLIVLIAFPFVSVFVAPNLLRGIFDVTWQGMIFVTLGATLASWTAMVTAWQVFLYGPERFGTADFSGSYPQVMQVPTRRGHSPLFAIFVIPTIWAAMRVSQQSGTSSYPMLTSGLFMGTGLAILFLIGGGQFSKKSWIESKTISKFLSWFGPGFKKDENSAYEGHYLALWSFLLCLMVYAGIGVSKFFLIGRPPYVPTLALLLVFLMILCWGFSLIAFLLDRFRIPVLLPFLLWALLTSNASRTDHYFYVSPTQTAAEQALEPNIAPYEVICSGTGDVVVVAASGGGIKAAAWTARVLTGLENDGRASFPENPGIFGNSVRLISAVSGGSVGAMYFVNEYDPNGGGLPPKVDDLEAAVRHAESSSLDDIAWGLVYPDFLRIFVPMFKHLDRGEALEAALTRELPYSDGHLSSLLGEWRQGVLKGWRPSVVFNATVVESGQRLLLGTTDLTPAAGRSSFRDKEFSQFVGRDISIVTAARLSATFPFVSPAARPDIPDPQIHVVDGGYTDNFGMATLLAWLNEAFTGPENPVRRVLIVEIRASPTSASPTEAHWRGWPFQLYAPLSAMMNVRDSGQLPRNEEERDLLRRFGAVCNIEVKNAVFEYPPEDAPLSWHFSPNDKKQIETVWADPKTQVSVKTVREFLAGTSVAPPSAKANPSCRSK